MKIRKFHWRFPLSLVLKTRGFGTRKWPIKNWSTTTLDFETKAKSACLSRRLRIAVNSFAMFFPFNDAKNFTILIFLYLATLYVIHRCFQYCSLSVHYVLSWPNQLISILIILSIKETSSFNAHLHIANALLNMDSAYPFFLWCQVLILLIL